MHFQKLPREVEEMYSKKGRIKRQMQVEKRVVRITWATKEPYGTNDEVPASKKLESGVSL